mgnify:CR=1 FL=1
MNNARDIIKLVGGDVLARDLGVGKKSLSHAAVRGVFPARWYVVIKGHCEAAEIECPYGLFSFILPEETPEFLRVN